jgi:hypothetical protein
MIGFKTGLMTLATIASIGGAFAFNRPHKQVGTTYYGYLDGSNNARWALMPPDRTSCQTGSSIACTITSTTNQATVLNTVNAFPANYTVLNASEGKIYK